MPVDQQFLESIRSKDAETRFTAWRGAGEQDPENIAELAKLADDSNPGVAKAAREAITTLVHSVGQDESSPKRQQIVAQLIAVPNGHTLRMLSLIGGDECVAPVAKFLKDPALREEAIFCLERVPGKPSAGALMTAFYNAPEDFKPRVLAALGHRKVPEAASICLQAMKSPNKEIAVAAARAFGRIGQKPPGLFQFPPAAEPDSKLRYADSQRNTPTAIRIYKDAMASSEPHLQCAGIVGLAKLRTPEAAAAIYPMTKSTNDVVRITAQNAFKKMADVTSP